jgi:hypothetical protein
MHISFVFRHMFQVFYLDILKVDLGEHMFAVEPVASGQRLAATVRVPPWVTMRVSKADRCLYSVHTQTGQVTRTDPIRMQVCET